MRTTLNIDDALLTEAKRRAADTRRTLTSVIEDALRSELARGRVDRAATRQDRAVTFKGSGTRPGVNLDRMSELLDIMDGIS